MMSTIKPVLSCEPGLVNPFQDVETLLSHWDSSDLYSILHASFESVETKSGSDKPNSGESQNQTDSTSGSEDRITTGADRLFSDLDERRQKRKISNRESARRSRMKKQKHMESLSNQLNRLRMENQNLANRNRYVLYHLNRVLTDNDRLRLEHGVLRQKLTILRQVLISRQFQVSRSTKLNARHVATR